MIAAEGAAERRVALEELRERACACVRCPELVRSRTRVVFGSGPGVSDLMLVGEAPGRTEDRTGALPAGEASALLDELLASIGRSRADVVMANVVRCRPPDNRGPLRSEVESCHEYLATQVALVRPVVVCALGGFAARTLRGEPTPIGRLRGGDELRVIGTRAVRLVPLLHPAAALYTAESVAQLREDFLRIPALLALGEPEQPEPEVAPPDAPPPAEASAPEAPSDDPVDEPPHEQLGLF